MTRIELATTAWKAVVLPLNYTRLLLKEMARDGIEPPTHGASIHCSVARRAHNPKVVGSNPAPAIWLGSSVGRAMD